MATFVHKPTRVESEPWTGDEYRMRSFVGSIDRDARVEIDGRTLWITQHQNGRLVVLPVVIGQYVVAGAGGMLVGMSPREFGASYRAAPQLATV